MTLTPEQIKQVAQLARLGLSPEKTGVYAQQLTNIMAMIDQLSAANTDGVSEMAHPLELTQRLRPDAVTAPDQRETFQAHAPAVHDGLYLVPQVLETE